MSDYADSSFLVSCYLPDTNSTRARNWLNTVTRPLLITSLQDVEIRNAIQLGVFRAILTQEIAAAALSDFDADIRAGLLSRQSVNWETVFRNASRLSGEHSARLGTRSLDLLHVACAKLLRAKRFASFDVRQCKLAATVKLAVVP